MLYVFSIRDIKACIFNTPFFAPHTQHAVRSFARIAADPQSNLNAYPEDFELWFMGAFNDDGTWKLLEHPEIVTTALQTLKRPAKTINPEDIS